MKTNDQQTRASGGKGNKPILSRAENQADTQLQQRLRRALKRVVVPAGLESKVLGLLRKQRI